MNGQPEKIGGKSPSKGHPRSEDRQKEMLLRIGKKEEELQLMLQEVRAEALKIVETARRQAEATVAAARNSSSAELDRQIEAGLEGADGQVRGIADEARKTAGGLAAATASRIEAAARMIMEGILPGICRPGKGKP